MLPILRHILTSTPKILLFDSFSRADTVSGLGTPEKGSVWQYGISFARSKILNGAAGPAIAASSDYCFSDIGKSNFEMEVVVRSIDTSVGNSPLVFRYVSTSSMFRLRVVDGVYGLYYYSALLLGTLGTYAPGDVLKIRAIGTNIKIWINGIFVGEANDSRNLDATKVGFNTSTGNTPTWIDSIKAVSV